MGRRTVEGKTSTEEVQRLPAELLPAPPPRRQGLRMAAVVAGFLVLVAGIWTFALTRRAPERDAPGTTGGAPSPAVSSPPAMTLEAFAALPSEEQKAIIEQAIARAGAILDEAYRTLNPALLPQVYTGAALELQQQQLGELVKQGRPSMSTSEGRILHIAAFPELGFVSVIVEGTETSWWLDPKTLQPTGTPAVRSGRSSLTLVLEDGVWKLKERIEMEATP